MYSIKHSLQCDRCHLDIVFMYLVKHHNGKHKHPRGNYHALCLKCYDLVGIQAETIVCDFCQSHVIGTACVKHTLSTKPFVVCLTCAQGVRQHTAYAYASLVCYFASKNHVRRG